MVEISKALRRRYNLLYASNFLLGDSISNLLNKRREYRYDQKLLNNNSKNHGQTLKINTVSAVTADEFHRNYLELNKPVLLKGAALNWDCTKEWTPDFFKKRYGNEKVILNRKRAGLGVLEGNSPNKPGTMEQFINDLNSGSTEYLNFSPILLQKDELRMMLNHDWLNTFRNNTSSTVDLTLFIGGKSTMSRVHCEMPANFFIQIYGRKKYTFFDAQQWPVLKPHASRLLYYHSDFDPNNSTDNKFPLGSKLNRYEVILQGGDILYLPPFTWHQPENLDVSMGVSYKFSGFKNAYRSSPLLLLFTMLATKPTIFKVMFKNLFTNNNIVNIYFSN